MDKNLAPLAIQKSDHGAEVTLPMMEPGKEQKFWVIYECCKIFKFSSEVPGLKLTQSVSDYDSDSEDNFLWWIKTVGLLFAGIIVGGVIDYKITRSSLQKRGHDLDAMIKEPETTTPSPTPTESNG